MTNWLKNLECGPYLLLSISQIGLWRCCPAEAVMGMLDLLCSVLTKDLYMYTISNGLIDYGTIPDPSVFLCWYSLLRYLAKKYLFMVLQLWIWPGSAKPRMWCVESKLSKLQIWNFNSPQADNRLNNPYKFDDSISNWITSCIMSLQLTRYTYDIHHLKNKYINKVFY